VAWALMQEKAGERIEERMIDMMVLPDGRVDARCHQDCNRHAMRAAGFLRGRYIA
jgi:hypothetical protein